MRTAQATTALALTLTPAGQALAQSSGGGGFRPWMIVVGVIAILVFLILMFAVGSYIRLYIQAFTSNARVTILDLVGMRLRRARGNPRGSMAPALGQGHARVEDRALAHPRRARFGARRHGGRRPGGRRVPRVQTRRPQDP